MERALYDIHKPDNHGRTLRFAKEGSSYNASHRGTLRLRLNKSRYCLPNTGLNRPVGIDHRFRQRYFFELRFDSQIQIEVAICSGMGRVSSQPLTRSLLAANAFQDSPGLADGICKSSRSI